MKAFGTAGETDGNDVFTEKQRQVLDLLIEHKTSKEIARALHISPYTVDQRISLARAKLGVSSRNELAARYREMQQTSGQTLSDAFGVSEAGHAEAREASDTVGSLSPGAPIDQAPQQESARPDLAPTDISSQERFSCPTSDKLDYRVGPEMFEGRSGGLWRLGAIVATALLLVMMVLGLFAIFDQLNTILA